MKKMNANNYGCRFLFTCLILVSDAAYSRIQWSEQPNLYFKIRQEMQSDEGERALQFLDLTKILSISQLTLSSPILALDKTQLVPISFDSIKTGDDKTKVRKILLVKSAVKIARTFHELEKKLSAGNIMRSLQKSLHFSYDPQCLNDCQVTQKLSYGPFKMDVDFQLSPSFTDLRVIHPYDLRLLEALEVAGANAQLQLSTRSWSNVFTMSQSNSFLIDQGPETLIVSFQLFAIKEYSYRTPMLDSLIKENLVKETEKLIDFLKE